MDCPNHEGVALGLRPCSRCQRSLCPDCLVALRGRDHCAACRVELLRDIASGTVPGELDLATTGARFSALFVDGLLGSVWGGSLAVGQGLLLGALPPSPLNAIFPLLLLGLSVAGMLLYEALLLARSGQTLGKMAIGIRVVNTEGLPITSGQAWGRTLLKQVVFPPFLCCYYAFINYLPAFMTRDRTCLHHLAARTRVVKARAL
jgi:uncharacterized RDD family membrane protein YckC